MYVIFLFSIFILSKVSRRGGRSSLFGVQERAAKGTWVISILPWDLFLIFLFFKNEISWANIEFPGIQDVFPSPKFHWADSKKKERNPYRAKENKAHVWKFQIVLITQEIAFWQPQERVNQYIRDYILREKKISLSYIQCWLRVNRWSYCFASVTSKF